MSNQKWIDLALKYGGFMEQDKVFLENRLENLTDETEKKLLVTPPASVLNAYFAELYQKRSPKDATNYFFELSKALDIFADKPDFKLEGKPGSENFRFIRLNLSGKSFGFCYKNAQEEALVFSEFPLKITHSLLFDISQIFPDYVLVFNEAEDEILMKPVDFGGAFEPVKSMSALTDLEENEKFMKLSSYNVDDLLEQAEQIGYFAAPLLQFGQAKFNLYISKMF